MAKTEMIGAHVSPQMKEVIDRAAERVTHETRAEFIRTSIRQRLERLANEKQEEDDDGK